MGISKYVGLVFQLSRGLEEDLSDQILAIMRYRDMRLADPKASPLRDVQGRLA